MRIHGMLSIAVILSAGVTAMAVDEEQLTLEVDIGVKLASAYVWRGRVINSAPVFQPEATLRIAPITLNVWGTWDWSAEAESSARSRVDASFEYSFEWEKLYVTAGMVIRAYHDDPEHQAKDTYETYVRIVADAPFFPSLTVFYDFGTIDGYYAVLTLADRETISDHVDVEFKVGLGAGSEDFNQKFFANDIADSGHDISEIRAGVVDLRASLSLPMSVFEGWVVTPQVEYITLLDPDMRDMIAHSENVVGSLSIVREF